MAAMAGRNWTAWSFAPRCSVAWMPCRESFPIDTVPSDGSLYRAAIPLTNSCSFLSSTASPGRPTSRLIRRTPSVGEMKVTTSPRCGSPSRASDTSVSGTLKSYARRSTSTTSPSRSVGCIEADGIGFQSATAVRKNPRHRRKIRKPKFSFAQRFIGLLLDLWLDELREERERILPAEIAGFRRDGARNALLHDIDLRPEEDLLQRDGRLHLSGQIGVVEPVRVDDALVRHQLEELAAERV